MPVRHVGWLSDGEWAQVYKDVFHGNHEEKKNAFDVMGIWRNRFTAKVPVAIEATYRLLEITLEAENLSQGLKQQALAAGLLQFIGLVTENSLKNKSSPIRTLGEDIGLPEWLMSLRNSMAHGPIPSLYMLNTAISFCWQWLKENHWDEQMQYNSFCVQLPCMESNVSREKPFTIEDEIFSVLVEYSQQINSVSDVVIDLGAKLKNLCQSRYNAERLCVVFVVCNHYDFHVDVENVTKFLNNLTFPQYVARQWRPLVIRIAASSKLHVLLYCFLHELCNRSDVITKAKLALWSVHVVDVLINLNKTHREDKLIINECIKLLISNSDIFCEKVYEKLSTYISSNSQFQQHSLNSLNKLFDSSLIEQSESKPNELTSSESVDDFISELKSTRNDSAMVAQKQSSTWSLYSGKSMQSSPIGLLPGQNRDALSQKLFNFPRWSVYKSTNSLRPGVPDCDEDELDDMEYAQEHLAVFSQKPTKLSRNIEHEEIASGDEHTTDANLTDVFKSPYKHFVAEDWEQIVLTIDTF